MWELDELQNASISNTQETVDITGKNGRLLNTLKRNKAVTISASNGLLSAGLMASQVGSEFATKTDAKVKASESLTVNSNKATLTYKAVGTSGNEIKSIRVRNSDGTMGATYTQGSAVGDNVFTYSASTKEIAFKTGALADGSEIIVHYDRKIKASVLDNLSDKYSEKAELIIDAIGEDKCGKIYRLQFHVPKADISGNFDISLGGDQQAHAFEARSQAGARCGTGSAAPLWSVSIYGENEADAA